jgi:hypothetical protein
MPESLAADLADQETWQAEKDIPVNNDADDTREAAEQREVEQTSARNKKVPLAALQEERQKRQALELQLQAQAQQLQQFMAQQQAAQQAQQEAALPEFSEDPETWVKMKAQQLEQALAQVQNGPAQQQQAAVQQQQMAFAVDSLEKQFMTSVPDYEQAADTVYRNADAQIRQLYPQATEQQFSEIRAAALSEFARQCLANGINPAQQIYTKAQQLGYKPASLAPRREPPTSLSTAHGSSRAPDERSSLRAADIASMSEAEFDDYWRSMARGATVRPAV